MRTTLRETTQERGKEEYELPRPKTAALRPSSSLHRWSATKTEDEYGREVSEKPTQKAGRCLFFEMPAEINYEIIRHLSHPDARQLKNTSKFFRMYITTDYLKQSELAWKAELLEQDLRGTFTYSGRLPCYSCVRLRPSDSFPTTPAGSAIPRCSERRCVDCAWKSVAKGRPIWIDSKPYTRCNWCGRAGKAHRYAVDTQRPGLCGLCGRIRRLAWVWPAMLIQWAEVAVNVCTIIWVGWGNRTGWLVGNSWETDWDVGEVTRVLIIIPTIQLFLCGLHQWMWHSPTLYKSVITVVVMNFWYGVFAWIWALCEPSSIDKTDPRAYQLCVFATAAGVSAIVLSFLRLAASVCAGRVPF